MAIYRQREGTDAPGARRPDAAGDRAEDRRVLPLGGRIEPFERGWRLRLRVRAEDVSVSKRTLVAEEVLVRTRAVEDLARVRETVRREELRIDADQGLHADVTQPLDSVLRRETARDTTNRFERIDPGSPRIDA